MKTTSAASKMEDEIDRLTHDAEHAETGAAFARQMKDVKSAKQLDVKAAHLRQRAADLQLALPLVMARESREKAASGGQDARSPSNCAESEQGT